jgi:oligoribonuclease
MLGVFLDIETSGLDPFQHDPLEIAFIIVDLLSGAERARYESFLQVSQEEWSRGDPSSFAINRITQEMLKQGKSRGNIAQEIETLLLEQGINNDRAFFICQNPSFDRPFFSKIISSSRQQALDFPYHWLDLASMYFAKRLVFEQKKQEFSLKLSKNDIARAFSLPEEERPHRAMNGARHLLLCYTHLIGF